MSKIGNLNIFLLRDFFLPFFFNSFLLTIVFFGKDERKQKRLKKYIKTAFLYHGPLIFATREPLLPLSAQNPLDRDFWIKWALN